MTPNQQLDGFIARYTPEVATEGRAALGKLRRLIPGAVELVYDNGRVVRNVKLASAADLDLAPVRALIREALKRADVPIVKGRRRQLIIKSISAKQRPRRPRLTTSD